jgi:hypothetical protein
VHQISETHVLGIVTNTSNCRTLEPDLIGETEEDLEGVFGYAGNADFPRSWCVSLVESSSLRSDDCSLRSLVLFEEVFNSFANGHLYV